MEEEVETREKPKEEVKPTKTRASIPLIFEVFSFTSPKVQDEKVCESEELISSDKADAKEGKEVKLDRMKLDKELVGNEEKSSNEDISQGVKRKIEPCNHQTKMENSKKAYTRRVQAYKRR